MANDEGTQVPDEHHDDQTAGAGSEGEAVNDPLTRREAEPPRTSWDPDKDR